MLCKKRSKQHPAEVRVIGQRLGMKEWQLGMILVLRSIIPASKDDGDLLFISHVLTWWFCGGTPAAAAAVLLAGTSTSGFSLSSSTASPFRWPRPDFRANKRVFRAARGDGGDRLSSKPK